MINNKCEFCCSKIENFSVSRGKTQILKNINLDFHCGDITAIIGPNGAGKTTLLKAILGEIPHTGSFTFLNEKGRYNESPTIGYVPQHLDFDISTPMSVLDLFAACNSKRPVWIGQSKKRKEMVYQSLKKVNMQYAITRKIGALSGGELQRVLLALALEPVPNILLLDEPISGIDQLGTQMFYETISNLRKEYDMAIVLVSHDLNLLGKYADKVVLINKEIQCMGSPKEVFENEKTREIMGTFWIGG